MKPKLAQILFIENMDEKESSVLIKILSILYCRSICREFRQPVEILYPNLLINYLSVIKYPMDLGTLLLAAMKRKMKVTNYRDGLRLVFSNCMQFNSESDLMINISKHLDRFACGLYEEAFCQAYKNVLPPDEFLRSRLFRRSSLYSNLCLEHLKYSEVKAVIDSIQSAILALQSQSSQSGLTIPHELLSVAESSVKVADNALEVYRLSEGSKVPKVSISDLLRPLLEFLRTIGEQHGITETDWTAQHIVTAQLPLLLIILGSKVPNSKLDGKQPTSGADLQRLVPISRLISPYLPYLRVLDENLGLVLVCIQERLLRGCIQSVVWAIPHSCVIDQSGRPAITLVGSPEANFSLQPTEENIARS